VVDALRLRLAYLSLLFYCSVTVSAFAANYQVDLGRSQLTFTTQHAGNEVKASFTDWQAQIHFDASHLEQSRAVVTINMQAVNTGDKLYDGTLPQADWFAVNKFPQAIFKSRQFTPTSDGHYEVRGELTLRGITKPVLIRFTLKQGPEDSVIVTGTTELKRLDFQIGTNSDPQADWVSKTVTVTFSLYAKAQPNH